MTFDESIVVTHVRLFLDDNKSAKNNDPYDAILTVQYMNDHTVYLCGLLGKITREAARMIIEHYLSRGYKVMYMRKGRLIEEEPKKQ